MANPAVHWEINGRDGKKLHEFYSKLFDWKIQSLPEMKYFMCDVGEGGIGGGLSELDPKHFAKPFVTFYFHVEDLDATLEKVVKMGGKIVAPPMEIGGGFGSSALFSDLDGNLIGLWKPQGK